MPLIPQPHTDTLQPHRYTVTHLHLLLTPQLQHIIQNMLLTPQLQLIITLNLMHLNLMHLMPLPIIQFLTILFHIILFLIVLFLTIQLLTTLLLLNILLLQLSSSGSPRLTGQLPPPPRPSSPPLPTIT